MALVADKHFPRAPRPEVTQQAVESLLHKHGLTCPSSATLAVTEALQIISCTVPLEHSYPDDFVIRYNRFADAVALIAEDGPAFAVLWRERTKQDREMAGIMSELIGSAERAKPVLAKLSYKHQSAFWHEDADYLRYCLRGVRTRAGTRPSFTKPAAPAVKFIQDAFQLARLWHPKVEREVHPTCAAIADALDRKQRTETYP